MATEQGFLCEALAHTCHPQAPQLGHTGAIHPPHGEEHDSERASALAKVTQRTLCFLPQQGSVKKGLCWGRPCLPSVPGGHLGREWSLSTHGSPHPIRDSICPPHAQPELGCCLDHRALVEAAKAPPAGRQIAKRLGQLSWPSAPPLLLGWYFWEVAAPGGPRYPLSPGSPVDHRLPPPSHSKPS